VKGPRTKFSPFFREPTVREQRNVDVIARMTQYQTAPDTVGALVDEVVDVARRGSMAAVKQRKMVAEFFFVNTESGECLSLLLGDDRSIAPVIELADQSGSSEELAVNLLQLGGPRDSGVVDALLGRVVRCPPHAVADVSFNGGAVPSSPEIWLRVLLGASNGDVVAVSVGTDPASLQASLEKFSARCPAVTDYDDVVYHFWRDRE
jgi:hypothetical protein